MAGFNLITEVMTERLDTWKDIAAYLGRNVRTVMRWERGKGLPVHRVPGGERQAVYAWKHEIDQWLEHGHPEPDDPKEAPDELARLLTPPIRVRNGQVGTLSQDPNPVRSPQRTALRSSRSRAVKTASFAAITAAVAIGAYALRTFVFPHSIRFTRVVQITDDGTQKVGLVTDGRNIYFGEYRSGRVVLSSIPTEGGTIREIPTPLVKAFPADISRDGKKLLVLVREGHEVEKELWVVPVSGEAPYRVGSILCQTAAWSPDGRSIAIAVQNAVLETQISVNRSTNFRHSMEFQTPFTGPGMVNESESTSWTLRPALTLFGIFS
jgi:hypothetical protein